MCFVVLNCCDSSRVTLSVPFASHSLTCWQQRSPNSLIFSIYQLWEQKIMDGKGGGEELFFFFFPLSFPLWFSKYSLASSSVIYWSVSVFLQPIAASSKRQLLMRLQSDNESLKVGKLALALGKGQQRRGRCVQTLGDRIGIIGVSDASRNTLWKVPSKSVILGYWN